MFLEHFTGFPATPRFSPRPEDALLDPLLLGVLTAAVEDESAEAYQQGFRDGLRTAALLPDSAEAADASADEEDWHR